MGGFNGRRATTLLLVGPDGTGKSTTAHLLAASEAVDVLSTSHYRPGILWPRNPEVTVTPHAETERSVITSAVKLCAVFVDFVLGFLGPWRRCGRSGLIVLERGWWDHLADPVRYRIPRCLFWLPEFLAIWLPRVDVVVVLGGDPEAIVRRKPELSQQEVVDQLERWRSLAPRAGRQVVVLDTVASGPKEIAGQIESVLRAAPGQWLAVPGTPKRNRVCATAGFGGSAALGVYRANSRIARLAAPISRLAVSFGWGRGVDTPDPVLARLPAVAGLSGSVSMAAMQSPGRERLVVGLAEGSSLCAVAKVGRLDDAGLQKEASVLCELMSSNGPVRAPLLRFAGRLDDRFVVVTEAVVHHGRPVGRDEIDPVLEDLSRAGDAGLVHGDLAPWNLVRTADGTLVVLDFEHARWGTDPLFDLCHFLVQCGALLGTESPLGVVEDLRRSLVGCGTDGSTRAIDSSVAEVVHHYVDVRRSRGDASADELQFMSEVEQIVQSGRRGNHGS